MFSGGRFGGREGGDTQGTEDAKKMELSLQGVGGATARRVRAKTGVKVKTSSADWLDYAGFVGCAGSSLVGGSQFIKFWRGNSVCVV